MRADPGRFAWRTEPYEFIREPIAIDLLFGSSREREVIEDGGEAPPVDLASWLSALSSQAGRRRDFVPRTAATRRCSTDVTPS